MNKRDALFELQHQMELLREIHDECAGIIEDAFPEEMSHCKAYGVLDFGWSSNPYDRTLERIIEDIEKKLQEEMAWA